MNERFIRLIRIITLIQSKPGILARELAERCETTERTIYRDLELLSASYVPITNNGHGKGYSFISNFSLYPLNWSNDEATAFTFLPSVLEQIKELIPADFFPAYEKVMASYHKEKSVEKEFLNSVIQTIQMGRPAYKQENTNYLSTVIQAILQQRSIDATYPYTKQK
jgi:predicted DNA-binding transcriptional regulator YafY